MFGRDAESVRVEQLLDMAVSGPAGLAFEGAAGIGKTTLWRDGVAAARRRGYTVMTTAPAEPDAALAFAGLGDLFDGLPEEIWASLPRPQRQAMAAALLIDDGRGGEAPPDPHALPRAVLSVLRQLAASGPLLVAIDDEHWLDRPSARVLAFALCRVNDEPVCVLLSRRPSSAGALWPELSRGFGTEGLPAAVIDPLEPGAVQRLLEAELGRPVSAPLLRRIHDVSAGNPLYALAIAKALGGSAGLGDQQLPIPPTLADAIARGLERLDARATDPLLVLAASSNPTLTLVQAVCPGFSLSDLDSAVRENVIEVSGDRVRFTHPLVASTHYARAPGRRRRELHRLLAAVVTDEEERAQHLALGAEAPDRQTAVAIEQAAGHASRRGAPEVAAALLEQAARLTPGDAVEAQRSRAVAAAEQHKAAGDLGRARSLLETVLAGLPGGPVRARALGQLAQLRTDDLELMVALLNEALLDVGDHNRIAAQIEGQLAEAWANQGDQNAAIAHSRSAIERAEQTNDLGLLAQTLAGHGVMAFFFGDGVQHDVMARAIALEEHAQDTPSYQRPSTALGLQLFWSDDLDGGRPLLERSRRRAIERGEVYDLSGIAFHLAHLESEAGNVATAERRAAEAIDSARGEGDAQMDSYMLWLLAFLAARRGNLVEARARATDAVELAASLGDNFIVSFATSILAGIELWSGQAEAAHERLAPLREAMVGGDGGFVGALTLPFWSYDIEALIALRRPGEATPVLDHLFERAHRSENPNALAIAHRSRGLMLASRGDGPGAIEAMERALVQHRARTLPLDLGRTLLEKGTLERRAKRKSAAKRSLEQALEILEPLQASLWAERARDELGRVGLRRPTVSVGLTPAQTRVAELVVSGMSNREVADTLYMSLRTVEAHLTKVYRERGVRSRAQLIATVSADQSHDHTTALPGDH